MFKPQSNEFLRRFLNFWTAIVREILQKWIADCRPDDLIAMRFAFSRLHLCKVLRVPRRRWRSEAMSCKVLHLSRKMQNHLSKPEDLIGENATRLKKSTSWPTNFSDQDVSCTASAMRNASLIIFAHPLQTFHACHRFRKCCKAHTFGSLLTRCTIHCACHAKPHQNFKKLSETVRFKVFDIEMQMCFAPQRRAFFRHRSHQKWSKHVFCVFRVLAS